MGVAKNIGYSVILKLSNYIFGIILLPYVARVLGVELYGKVEFVTNIVAYALLFSSLGVTSFGIREVAKNKNNKRELNKVFTNILLINILFTILTIIVYIVCVFYVNSLYELRSLFFVGTISIIFTPFVVEWLFRGIEDFKYITIRSFIIRLVYVIFVLLFVKNKSDYEFYYVLTVLVTVANALINIIYARKYVKFRFARNYLKTNIKKITILGSYDVLTSMYTTFNLVFLGFVTNSFQVGLYAAALKLYAIIIGIYSAFSTVMLPRISTLVSEQNIEAYQDLVNKSMITLYTISFPLLIFCECFTKEIVIFIVGYEFINSVVLMKIIMPLIVIVGLAQILVYQVIMPHSKDKILLKASIVGAIIGILLNTFLVSSLKSVGTGIALFCTECVVTIYYLIVVFREKLICFNTDVLIKHVLYSMPYILFCIVISLIQINNILIILLVGGGVCGIYFMLSQYFLIKNDLLKNVVRKIINNR